MTNDSTLSSRSYRSSSDHIKVAKRHHHWIFVIGHLTLILILFLATTSFASSVVDLTEIGVGARPLGMGKAFSSIADDGSAIFSNPAGLSSANNLNIISMSGNLINEFPYTLLGGSYRTQAGVFGIGYVGSTASGIKEAVLVGGTPEVTGNEASYGNTTLILSYANEAKDINYLNNIALLSTTKVGANLKLMSHGFSGGASFEGGNSSGFDIDLGAIFPIRENLTGSLTIKNIIPGNNVGPDELPLGIGGGISLKLPDRNLLTALDAEISEGAFLLHLGAEWNPIKLLYIRGGLDQNASGINYALGLGTKYLGFTFDYAYHTYAELSEFTTHYFSIGYVLEPVKKEETKPILSTPAPALVPAPSSVQVKPAPAPIKPTIKPTVKKSVKSPTKKVKPAKKK